ncbi:MAG: glycosyltransferase family 1 protein [Candidatus Daviesbacteria bacterium]|nr:glycosyltransferase family 1 protein [Candidatus Daviesbacteria bacterium]
MIIGFDGSRAFAEERTGTENYSYQLLKALLKIDKHNKYIVYTRSNLNFKFLWTQLGLAIQTFKDHLDVLFVPAHTLPLIRRPGLKTVVTIHDLGSEYLPDMYQLKQRLYLSFMQKYQLQTATKIIAVSKATKMDLIRKIGVSSEKVRVIYEGFDKTLFKPVKNNRPKNYFLFVGTVQPRKNLERLIIAFSIHLRGGIFLRNKAHLGGVTLVIAGGKGWMSDEIYELPKKLGIEDRVKFLGYVPEGDLPALYSGAIALTFPSLFEGFGLPILEAQACGCPVLTSNISSMPEIGGKGAVYVDPYDVNDIVKGMERLQATACLPARQGYRQQLIKEGFENVKRFSWEKCAAQTLEVFENLKL